jgi:AcrR family transcriptional regulator
MVSRPARSPRQQRGQARVARLLDAAAEMIAENGVAGLTMAGVSERAGSAPGSLYQFFPNRETLIDALAQRYAAEVERCIVEALADWTQSRSTDPAALVDALLPPLFAFYRAHPAWGELLHALSRRGAPGRIERALDRAAIQHLAAALAHLDPRASAQAAETAAAVLLDLGHAGLTQTASGSDAFATELRRCLVAYLEAWRRR